MIKEPFQVFPIGVVRKTGKDVFLEIYKEYERGLLGLDEFSHIYVFSWFHKNDTVDKRSTLQVHPRRNKANPLTGVFATRSPLRPNLISISICELLSIKRNKLNLDKIDMFNGSPVLDIKPCLSMMDFSFEVKVPDWARNDGTDKGRDQKSKTGT